MSQSHHRELRAILTRVRRRWIASVTLRAGTRAAVGAGVIIVAAVMIDRLWVPSDLPLLGLASVALLGSAAFVGWIVWPLRRLPSRRQVARFVEERAPELEDRVASAAELGDRTPTSPLQALLVADAARRISRIDLERVVSRSQVRRAAGYGAIGAAALVMVLGLAVEPARRAAGAGWLYLFPDTIQIDVTPGDARIITGQPLRVRARVSGVARASGRTRPTLEFGSDDDWRDVEMQPVDDGFQFEFSSVTEDFTYRVTAARARSDDYTVTALSVPRVERIDVEYDYPPFTGLERRIEVDGGDVYAPVGTAVTLIVHADKPVQAGTVVRVDGTPVELTPRAGVVLAGAFEVRRDDSYRVRLSDADGLSSPGEMEYFIRAIDDRPPDVRVLRPADDRPVTPLEEVTIEARADDDYGLERFELVYAVRGGEEQAVPFRGPPLATTIAGTHTLYIEDMQVQPGDFITYYARARDVNRAKASTEARSDIFFLEVTPFEEAFVEAQSQEMAGGGSSGLDDLAEAQKDIIIATWNLDRRSAGGTSESDVRAVARVQGELRARTEQAVQGDRRGRRAGPPAVTDPNAAGDPLGLAVDAMSAAESSLDAIQTAGALPHEMAALNQLLRAEAEIRQRQVARQQRGGGGGGSGRASQDLSALFDRALQAGHETNYETRSRAEQRQETPESEALARVRELARRQDDLSRRQRDLDRRRAELSPQEMRRQLERLTREQSELRRQAEELARELSQQRQARADQPSEAAQAADAEREQMREISEAMRGATSDLRRQDLASASARGEEALEQLRNLERQLQASDPSERQRVLGELQLEAQRLAEAERRIATESDQLDAGPTGRDARRRLADDQDGLAGRVDTLEQEVQRLLSAGAEDEAREALDAAARELDRERVAEQMRDTAETLRGLSDEASADPQGELARLAETEARLANALDRVAGRIGQVAGDASAGARRLSEELARARELLDVIARQLDALAQPGEGSSQSEGSPDAERDATAGDGRGAAGELARLRQAYEQELRQAQDLLDQLRVENPALEQRLQAEGSRPSVSAPGTEAFKQDYARWDELRRDVALAIEWFEATRSQLLASEETRDRFGAGGDDRIPEAYRVLVEKYYQSLASTKRP